MHTFTGQVWATRTGVARALLRTADQVTAHLATHVLTDSESQRVLLIDQGIVPAAKLAVLAQGSLSGVDLLRFRPDPAARVRVRQGQSIPENAIVFLYLGRMQRDKGVIDLARAFASVAASLPNVHLLLVGPDEGHLITEIRLAAGACSERLHTLGFSNRPEEFLAAADVLCLPSYREGFPKVLLEAAAAGIPAIGSRIYGITDALVEGETGWLFPAGNVPQLAHTMGVAAGDAELRARFGQTARERAERSFSATVVTDAWLQYHKNILAAYLARKASGHEGF